MLRQRRGWRQVDVSAQSGVSAALIGLLERGGAGRCSVRSVRRVASVLELDLSWDVGWRGAELDRLRDRDHAAVANLVKGGLEQRGWLVEAEVSFSRYGERGRIDLLAFHPIARILLVMEIKTVVADIQQLLGGLDVKARLAPALAATRGWRGVAIVPCVVLVDGSTARRRVRDHASLFARFVLRGRAATAWLRTPTGRPTGLLLYVNLPYRNPRSVRRAGRQRVRLARSIGSVLERDDRSPSAPEPG